MINIDDVFYLKRNAAEACSKARRFATGMANCAETPFFADAGVVVGDCDNEDILLTLSTPVATGRLRSGWAGSPKDLAGVLVVERKQLDKYDRDRWDTILSICFHKDGRTSFHSAIEGLVDPEIDGAGKMAGDRHWQALMVTVYYLSRFNDIR